MKINVTNTDKLAAEIAIAEGARVSARTITADDVSRAVAQIEKRLSAMMPKKAWRGAAFVVDVNAQSFPGAYKGRPESTQFMIERGASGWFVTKIWRGYTNGPTGRIRPVAGSLDTAAIIEHATGAAWH